MATFYDDFERANGDLGGDWEYANTKPQITGGKVNIGNASTVYNTGISDGDEISSACWIYYNSAQIYSWGPAVKLASGSAFGYFCILTTSGGVTTFYLKRGNTSGSVTLASVVIEGSIPSYFRLTIKWTNGDLVATYNGTTELTASDVTYAGQNLAGFLGYWTYSAVNDCLIATGPTPELTVSPNPIGNYGACVTVNLTGSGTDWTTGTPGAPIFTVDHGTITAQEVTSATTATLTYCPGTYLGIATFTDPSTAATVGALVTSDPAIVDPAGGCAFNDAFVDMANETGTYYTPSRLMTIDSTIDLVPPMTIPYALSLIYQYMRAVVGGVEPDDPDLPSTDFLWKILTNRNVQSDYAWNPTRDTSLKEDLEYLVNEFITVRTVNDYTLGTVITTLAGEGVPTHKDIMDAVGELDAPDLQPVLDAIAALRGDQVATVKAVADQLDTIRSIGDYTLASVRTWVEAVRGTDQPTVKDVLTAIAALNNAPSTNLTPVLTAVAGVDTHTLSVIASLAAFFIPEAATVQTILTAIDAIDVEAPPSGGAPVWPGEANVTLGTTVSLTTGSVIEGPMDGVLIDITSAPANAGLYLFGTTKSYTHAGSIMFQTDRGDYEFPAKIAVAKHVLCPSSMSSAGHAILRVNSGFGGTITPWVRTL